jgi:hypothetical protein
VLRKVVFYYTRKHKNVEKIKTSYDLKLLSFLKMKHWIYKELRHFQNSYLLENDEEKKCHLFEQL